MKIQTFSIVIGTKACNAKCPFCVSRMTGFEPVIGKSRQINNANFDKACRLAQIGGTTTVLLTGKGEPTLYPREITSYLGYLEQWNFPFLELQTNAVEIGNIMKDGVAGASGIPGLDIDTLHEWRTLGLNTIAISAVDYRREQNQRIYGDAYGDLATTIELLHRVGYTVRLCIMMQQGCIDSPTRLDELVDYCTHHNIEQLTVRPIRKPKATRDDGATSFVESNGLTKDQEIEITNHIEKRGTRLLSLMHGAAVYDIDGQNVCLSDCLTVDNANGDIRTLIFYSDGRLTYDWQYEGAVILGGHDQTSKLKVL